MFKRISKDSTKISKSRPVISSNELKTNQTTLDSNSLERFEMPHKVSNNAAGSTLLLIVTLAVVTVAGLLMAVSSLWKFLNPDFNFSLPNTQVFSEIAKGINLPDYGNPDFSEFPSYLEATELEQRFYEFKNQGSEFLNQIPRVDLVEKYEAICVDIKAGSKPKQIAESIERDLVLTLPGLNDHEAIAKELVDGALQLCPAEEETQ